jgi:predicted transcriptional regulator
MVNSNVILNVVNILKYFEPGKEYTCKEIAQLSKMSYPSIFNYIQIIAMKGWVVETGYRNYTLSEKGQNVIDEYFRLLDVMEIDEVIPIKKPKEKPITEFKTQEELNKSIVEDSD